MKRWTWLAAMFLAACGGGGDDPPPEVASDPAQVEIPVRATVEKLWTEPSSFTMTSGTGARLIIETTPAANPSTFLGVPARLTTQTSTLIVNNQPTAAPLFLLWQASPFSPVGIVDAGRPTVLGNVNLGPARAKPGASGQLFTGVAYADSTRASVVGSRTATWSVNAADTRSAWLCARFDYQGAQITDRMIQTNCYLVTGAGGILRAEVTISVPGGTTAFR